jgi:hypothetical protein
VKHAEMTCNDLESLPVPNNGKKYSSVKTKSVALTMMHELV